MKLLLSLLTLALALSLRAQDTLYEEPVGWHGRGIELHHISDRDKQQHCLFLCNDDSIRAYVLDNKQVVIRHFYFKRLMDEGFLGGFIKDGIVYAFLQPIEGKTDLHVWMLSLNDGVANDYTVPFAMRHERAVAQISIGDHFLYFTANRKASEFVIYDFRENKICETLHYRFEDGIWLALLTFSGNMNVVEVDPDAWMNPDLAHIPNKLYWLRDTLFLTMNSYERGITGVFSFDMRAKKVNFRKIKHNIVQQMSPPLTDYVDNSILLDGKLYFVSADDDKLDVQVRDFYRGSLLKDFRAGIDEDIAFRNSAIVQKGTLYQPGSGELTQARNLILKMLHSSAVIMATREDSGRVGLAIGAWEQNKGLVVIPLGLGVPGAAIVAAASKAISERSSAINYNSLFVRSSRFKMLMDSASSQHVTGQITADLGDRIVQYRKRINIAPEGDILFKNGGRYVYAFYNRDEHKIVLTGF